MCGPESCLIIATAPSPKLVTFAWISIAVHSVCALIVIVDLVFGRRGQMAIMKVVWPLTTLYGGPLAVWAYFAFGRQRHMAMATHDSSSQNMKHDRRPMWQAALIGTTHCGAGCTLGDVIAETSLFLIGATTLLFGSALLTSYVVDFVAAYLLGVVFQYYAIVPMKHLSPAQGVWAAVKADTLSLIAFQVGMYTWMAIYQKLIFHPSLQPNSPVYWFMMQIGMIAGFVTSYPMNWLLIRTGIKEAM